MGNPNIVIEPKSKLRDIARAAFERDLRPIFMLEERDTFSHYLHGMDHPPPWNCRCYVTPLKTEEKEITMSSEATKAMTPEDGKIITSIRDFNIIAQAFDARGTLIETATFKHTGVSSSLSGWVRDHENRNGRRCVVTIGETDPFHPRERLGLTPPVPAPEPETKTIIGITMPVALADRVGEKLAIRDAVLINDGVVKDEEIASLKRALARADRKLNLAKVQAMHTPAKRKATAKKKRTRR